MDESTVLRQLERHRRPDPNTQSRLPVPETNSVTFLVSSLPAKVKLVSPHVRSHWTVENSLHWSLDVVFAEDVSRIRKGNGQEIIGSVRGLAFSILKRDTSIPKKSLRQKRLLAGWNIKALESTISAI